jgi:Asp-tRNA(Asn)/Glu-tRNA(Gln) amidotransferase A subunit family amidase
MPSDSIWITGPFAVDDGAPRLAVKDLFDTRGIRTTYGSAIFAEHVPSRTAAAVQRLEEAGWRLVGKANLHEFAYGITSQNDHYGTVPNPSYPGRTSGGSSGGSAAALAADLADAALGTDTGGSIRIPAACCGVAGFKPSFGLISVDGVFPLAPSFDHAGPLARDVRGCVELMQAIVPDFDVRQLESLEEVIVGVAWLELAEREVREAVLSAASFFPRRRVVDAPLAEEVRPAFMREVGDVHSELFANDRELYGDLVRAKFASCLEVSDADYACALAARATHLQRAEEALADCQLLLTPTLPILPPTADADELVVRGPMTRFTFPANATGWPALSLPCGEAKGLPASCQLIGRPGTDALVLAAGVLLEKGLGRTGPKSPPTP